MANTQLLWPTQACPLNPPCWIAGSLPDAVLTTCASQIGQILLTLPNAFAKTGLPPTAAMLAKCLLVYIQALGLQVFWRACSSVWGQPACLSGQCRCSSPCILSASTDWYVKWLLQAAQASCGALMHVICPAGIVHLHAMEDHPTSCCTHHLLYTFVPESTRLLLWAAD